MSIRVKRGDHSVPPFQTAASSTPNFHNITSDIGARDEVFFHRERVLSRGNGDVPEVERYATDFDKNLVLVDCTDGLFDDMEVVKASLTGKAEHFLGSHFCIDAKVVRGVCVCYQL